MIICAAGSRSFSPVLREVVVRLVPQKVCSSGEWYGEKNILPSMQCAGHESGGRPNTFRSRSISRFKVSFINLFTATMFTVQSSKSKSVHPNCKNVLLPRSDIKKVWISWSPHSPGHGDFRL